MKLSLTDLSTCFSQDDDDGHLLALQIIRDLVDKGGDVFLDQLARLGVINKVSTLAGPTSDDENEEEAKPEKVRLNSFHIFFFVVFVYLKSMLMTKQHFLVTIQNLL